MFERKRNKFLLILNWIEVNMILYVVFLKKIFFVYFLLVYVVYDIYIGWKIIVRFISVFNIDIFIYFFFGYIMIFMILNMEKLICLIKGWCIVVN